ncbi:GNAT family N-acetyltransferase [Phaeovulum sp. W22_SRMD_FR3]
MDALAGRSVELVVLDPCRHAEAFHLASHGAEKDALWQFLRDGPFANGQAHQEHLARLCASDQFSGYVLFLPALQRTRGGTESLFLLMRHAFETMKLRRYAWRCDSRNVKSERAALRLGFRQEGHLRQHMMVKDHNRDTLIFSLLDIEWPGIKAALTACLADKNFDAQGNVRRSLDEINRHMTPLI